MFRTIAINICFRNFFRGFCLEIVIVVVDKPDFFQRSRSHGQVTEAILNFTLTIVLKNMIRIFFIYY